MLAPAVPLWSHQDTLLLNLQEEWKQFRRVLVQCPTGGGKTRIITWLAHRISRAGLSLVIGVHLEELIDQISRALHAFGIPHGVMAAGKADPIDDIYIASIPTMIHRLDRITPPDYYFRDEAHHSVAETDMRVFDHFVRSLCAGFTATPRRRDGTGLNNIYQSIVLGPQIMELIDHGHLVMPRLVAPPIEDLNLDEIHINKGGEFDTHEQEEAIAKSRIVGDAVEHYLRLCPFKQAIVFCVSISEAEKTAKAFNAAGIPSAVIHSKLTKYERRMLFDAFKRKEINCLMNVALFLEGVDVPAIEVVIWLRKTNSVIVWMQGNGRAMRADEGKSECLIIDHCGNWEVPTNGAPWADRKWDLLGAKKRQGEAAPPLSRCKECHYVGAPFTICPDCGAEREFKRVAGLKQVAGQLTFIDDEKITAAMAAKEEAQRRRTEFLAANTVELIEELGKKRGWTKAYTEKQKEMLSARIASFQAKKNGTVSRWQQKRMS